MGCRCEKWQGEALVRRRHAQQEWRQRRPAGAICGAMGSMTMSQNAVIPKITCLHFKGRRKADEWVNMPICAAKLSTFVYAHALLVSSSDSLVHHSKNSCCFNNTTTQTEEWYN